MSNMNLNNSLAYNQELLEDSIETEIIIFRDDLNTLGSSINELNDSLGMSHIVFF